VKRAATIPSLIWPEFKTFSALPQPSVPAAAPAAAEALGDMMPEIRWRRSRKLQQARPQLSQLKAWPI
jgi:hypothetical protein